MCIEKIEWRDAHLNELPVKFSVCVNEKVQVGKDQEKAHSEKRLTLQKPRWEKTQLTIRYLYHENISQAE